MLNDFTYSIVEYDFLTILFYSFKADIHHQNPLLSMKIVSHVPQQVHLVLPLPGIRYAGEDMYIGVDPDDGAFVCKLQTVPEE